MGKTTISTSGVNVFNKFDDFVPRGVGINNLGDAFQKLFQDNLKAKRGEQLFVNVSEIYHIDPKILLVYNNLCSKLGSESENEVKNLKTTVVFGAAYFANVIYVEKEYDKVEDKEHDVYNYMPVAKLEYTLTMKPIHKDDYSPLKSDDKFKIINAISFSGNVRITSDKCIKTPYIWEALNLQANL